MIDYESLRRQVKRRLDKNAATGDDDGEIDFWQATVLIASTRVYLVR